MAEIHHFTYGWFNPVAAFLMAFVGSLLGLVCVTHARQARTRGRLTRWLVLAAVSIGGAAMWLMHFMAMLGFDVPDTPVRYDPRLTFASLAVAVVPVYIGLSIVARGRRTMPRLLSGGLIIGLGVVGMHYAGLYALRVAGEVSFAPGPLGASAAIAVVATTAALWLATRSLRWGSLLLGAAVLGIAVCGSHYAAVASLRIRLRETPAAVDGIGPFLLIVPITLLTALTLIAMAISALQAMTEEEFAGVPARRGAHAEVSWRLDDGAGGATPGLPATIDLPGVTGATSRPDAPAGPGAAATPGAATSPVLMPTAILPPADHRIV